MAIGPEPRPSSAGPKPPGQAAGSWGRCSPAPHGKGAPVPGGPEPGRAPWAAPRSGPACPSHRGAGAVPGLLRLTPPAAPMAAAFAPKLGRSLASPDPHHGPGYAGYCPRYKFSLGQTYGQLLSSPEVAGSSQLVLQPARWPCAGAQPVGQAEELLGMRPACWGAGAHLLGCCMIPGYTGFIPRAQNLFAKTYSEICKEARSDFARQQLRAAGKEQELQNAGRLPQGTKGKLLTAKYRTPVPAGSAAAAPYVSPFAFQPQGSPYSMEDNNPHKCFISGFTGFVPRARFLIGAGYPLTTHRALVEFGQTRGSRPEAAKGSPVLPPLLKSYPMDMGLLPHYAGYVPGYKFQFGHTYGELTHNALGLSTLEKQMSD